MSNRTKEYRSIEHESSNALSGGAGPNAEMGSPTAGENVAHKMVFLHVAVWLGWRLASYAGIAAAVRLGNRKIGSGNPRMASLHWS
jgi:hypothetical protein